MGRSRPRLECEAIINADGSAAVELGSQDLGIGRAPCIAQVAAETLGLPITAIKVNLGDSKYPASGASGGSTTIGGVSASTRKSTVNAVNKLFEAVAPALGAQPDELEAVDGRIQVKGNASKGLPWQDACRKLGVNKIEEMGENLADGAARGPHQPGRGGRSDGRRFGGYRNRQGEAQPPGCGAGLRAGRESQAGRKPGVRRHHHEHLRAR